MRLYHVSEEENIESFEPRIPYRKDIDSSKGLVWALNDNGLNNFLTPRNCPRIGYSINKDTTTEEKELFFSSRGCNHVLVIESEWFEKMRNTTLYIYEFEADNFRLQDEAAGYYVSECIEKPISKTVFNDLFGELFNRNVEVRIVDNLWEFGDRIKLSNMDWSLCRMGFAKER